MYKQNIKYLEKMRLDALNYIRRLWYAKNLCKLVYVVVIAICCIVFAVSMIYSCDQDVATTVMQQEVNAVIPKIIHQIWIGSPISSLPEYKSLFMSSFKANLGNDWQYMLWTDANLTQQNFNLTWEYQQMARNAANVTGLNKFAQIADLMRYGIVYKYGGFYADTNMELFQSLDSLTGETFVVSHENGMPKPNYVSNSWFGAIKQHPALKALLQKEVLEKRNYSSKAANKMTGPGLFGPFLRNRQDVMALSSDKIYPTYQNGGWDVNSLVKQDKCISKDEIDGWKQVRAKDNQTLFLKFACDEYPNSIMADHWAFGASWT